MRALAVAAVLILGALIVWGVSWASYLPQFSIRTVSVLGAERVPTPLIQNYVESILHDGSHPTFSRSNIILYPRASIEKAVESFFPRIKSASISRGSLLATAIAVVVEERTTFARWCTLTQCYVMDEGGFVFAEFSGNTNSASTTHYIFRGGIESDENPIGQRFAPAHLPGILVLLTLLGQAGFHPLGGSIDNEQDLSILFKEGFALKVSFGQDANTLTKNLELVLSSEVLKEKKGQLEYIDLRFDNRVYYKMRGEGEAMSTGQ